MLTAKQKPQLWPSLSGAASSSSNSFFGDQKYVPINRTAAVPKASPTDTDDDILLDDELDCKAPAYKNQLGDCLANALASSTKSMSLKNAPTSGKKKKAKKTILFASGMNFN